MTSDEERWERVARRDKTADGAFYYSVATTGVYCRPSCSARLARRENVRFHDSAAAAEQAGFRPCKRCRPDAPALAERQAAAIARVCRLIEDAEEMPGLDSLAQAAGLSRFHFHRLFKERTGVTPKAYGEAHRARRLRGALAQGAGVTAAIYEAGFNSSSRFYATASQRLGMAPSAFRAGGRDITIRFAVGECALGSLLVAATGKGICAISLGDDPDRLVRELQDLFPKAQLVGGDAAFERHVAQVVGFIAAPAPNLGLPLDIQGTAFQQRVWEALRAIPPGATTTYGEIARRIGHPAAVRAVAKACAANRIAVAIPCHRVVRTDGALSGYRWGIDRKRRLLEQEAAHAEAPLPSHGRGAVLTR